MAKRSLLKQVIGNGVKRGFNGNPYAKEDGGGSQKIEGKMGIAKGKTPTKSEKLAILKKEKEEKRREENEKKKRIKSKSRREQEDEERSKSMIKERGSAQQMPSGYSAAQKGNKKTSISYPEYQEARRKRGEI
jgi:hypothetical protein